MKANSVPLAVNPRRYRNATSVYTPLNTQRLPRLGDINDFFSVGPGVLGVALQDGSAALVDEHDYFLLQSAGWTARWTQRKVTGDNCYPSINHGDRIKPLARIILDAQTGEKVRYRNGDRNDLTRGNLLLKAKGGQEIGFSQRVCPQAPALSSEERRRVMAKVRESVGSASIEDRLIAGQLAFTAATSRLAGRPTAAPVQV